MVKTYNVVLNNRRAQRLKMHFRNMGVHYISSECGGHQYIEFDYEEKDITDVQTLIDEVKCHFWAKDIIKRKRK